MELIQCKVSINFNLFLTGDWHGGSVFQHKTGVGQFLDHVNSSIDGLPVKNNKVVEQGDDIEAIDDLDPRFRKETERGSVLEQIKDAKKIRRGIRQHYVVKLIGNHELKKWHFGNITKEICDDINVPYGGMWCKITYLNRRNDILFKHFATHGKKPIRSTADDPKRRRTNKQLILKRLLKGKCGDAILMSRSHTHWLDRLPPEHDMYQADDGKQTFQNWTKADHTAEYIHPDLRWYVSCGSLLNPFIANEGIISYAEAADYDPDNWIGYMLCKVRNGKIQEIEPVVVD